MSTFRGSLPVRILHLSDIHFRAAKQWDADPVVRSLTLHIADEVKNGLAPDLVAVTGDLAFGGKAKEYKLAETWLQQLWPVLSVGPSGPLPRDRLLLVPGNHDANRDAVDAVAQMVQDGLLKGDQDQIAAVLSDPRQRKTLLKRHEAYLKFYGSWLGEPQPLPWWKRAIDIRGQRLHLAGLDSAWMSHGDTDRGRLLLGRYQLHQTVLQPDAQGGDWRLVLLHHPWDYLAEQDGRASREAIHLNCNLVLRGHLHEPDAFGVLPADPKRACLEVAAGSVYDGSPYPNAFQWIELHTDPRREKSKCVRVHFRAWIKGAWTQDRNQPGADENGMVEIPLATAQGSSIDPRTHDQVAPDIPSAYLDWLRERYTDLDLLGKGLKQGQAIRLSQVYVPAITAPEQKREEHRSEADPFGREEARPSFLLERIGRESLYCPAAPGAGKTTFCRWAVLRAVQRADWEPGTRHQLPPPEGFEEPSPEDLLTRLPVLVPLRDLFKDGGLGLARGDWHRVRLEQALADWIDRDPPEGLNGALFLAHLEAGSAFLLLDGLDEVPVRQVRGSATVYPRGQLISGLADALPIWERAGNRTLLTSRPYGLDDTDLHRLRLPRAGLEPLPDNLQALFVQRWFLTLGKPKLADELMAALDERDLSALTGNPLLLTALCVIYHNDCRLPGDIWELYHRICDNVLHNRYQDRAEERTQARARLAAIAYGMHTGEGLDEERSTPQAVATEREIERLLRRFAGLDGRYEQGQVAPAVWREELLTRSGLLLPRDGRRAAFYHLSIQEFLTADRIAGLAEDAQALKGVFRRRATMADWRPTLLFLFAGQAFHHRPTPKWSLELLTELSLDLDRIRVKANPAPAVFIAEALDLCLAKGYRPPEKLEARFRQTCLDAVEDEIAIPARHILGLSLGRLGDPRIPSLRDPAAYVEVPGGDCVYGEHKAPLHIEQPFLLTRYPVTNSQYRSFMEAGGYENSDWWSEAGWAWRDAEGVQEPWFWKGRGLNAPNLPVVGVTFWEAEACCAWAGGRLPSEQEWEAAARGPEGCEYPWCGDWEDGICNSAETGLNRTSPVGLFPRSRQAALGLEDLAGNVWEWCGSFYRPGDDDAAGPRVLRGGAFYDESGDLRATNRDRLPPEGRIWGVGFRCVLAPRRQP